MSAQIIPVVINRHGGAAKRIGDQLEQKVRQAFAEAGAEIDLHLTDGEDLDRILSRIPGALVVVGGGDGTLSTAARVLLRGRRRLAVLPLGTRNHFAAALGLDGTLEQAAKVAVAGQVQSIDLGMAGGRVFLNNASLGAYARMVRRRDAHSLPKWLATIPASLAVLLRPGAQRMRVDIDGETHSIRTPLLFIGNNRYSLDAGSLGERTSLSDSTLSLYAVADRSRAGLLLAAWRILRGKADPQSDFSTVTECTEVTAWRRGRHHIALDGEVVEMRFPLRFGIMPRAFEVMMPA